MADGFAQTVKAQTDVVRILGEYLKLRKSGANWSALCPFHKEKSGSFYVYPHTASYYCFGCHEHGDVFTFVMKMESVSFPGGGAQCSDQDGNRPAATGVRVSGRGSRGRYAPPTAGGARSGDAVLSAESALA